jgi:hypothetical protein
MIFASLHPPQQKPTLPNTTTSTHSTQSSEVGSTTPASDTKEPNKGSKSVKPTDAKSQPRCVEYCRSRWCCWSRKANKRKKLPLTVASTPIQPPRKHGKQVETIDRTFPNLPCLNSPCEPSSQLIIISLRLRKRSEKSHNLPLTPQVV